MDHEWCTSALDDGQTGWDWFSMQLSYGYDLMYYQIRNAVPTVPAQTTGTLVDPNGQTTDLEDLEVDLEMLDYWTGQHSGDRYPRSWTLSIPELEIELEMETLFDDQEMRVSVRYYEGTIGVMGEMAGEAITGTGYIEMTGYEN